MESGQALDISCEGVGQDFYGDLTFQLRVCRTIHFAHPAHADQGGNLVWTKPRARS